MTQNQVPTLILERLARGELPPDVARDVRARLGDTAEARLAALADDDARILAQLPPAQVATEVRRRLGARTPARVLAPTLGLAGAAFAAALLAVPDPAPLVDTTPIPDFTRNKGGSGPGVAVWRLRDGAVEALSAGDVARPGDTLQVSYAAGGHRYGLLFSVDGRGVVTLHHPARPEDPAELVTDGESVLSQAYELDDAPDHETFVLVASDHPIDVLAVIDAARRTAGAGPFVDSAGAPPTVVHVRVPKEAR